MQTETNPTVKNKKMCFIFGTRPEIIKLAPVIKRCIETNTPYLTIHTGQHYSINMDRVFLDGLEIPPVDYHLDVGSAPHGEQTGRMLDRIEKILLQEVPGMVIVQGDTNTVMAGALAAVKLMIPIAHVEGGLRSYDRSMPEEINRVVAGAVTGLHFVPTTEAAHNLLREGIDASTIYVVGNTIVDAVLQTKERAAAKSNILNELHLKNKPFSLITIHRPENSDSKKNLETILRALLLIHTKHQLELVWPIHPRTKKQVERFKLEKFIEQNNGLRVIEPVDYFDMLTLQHYSAVTITDSGGIQEESCILKVPCVTVRNNTERPESVKVGANLLSTCQIPKIVAGVDEMLKRNRNWENPFGDGAAAERIVEVINQVLQPEIAPATKNVLPLSLARMQSENDQMNLNVD